MILVLTLMPNNEFDISIKLWRRLKAGVFDVSIKIFVDIYLKCILM